MIFFSNIDTSFSYVQLLLSWLMYFSVMTLIVYDIVFVVHDIVFELLTRSLGLDSASTNKSFNLYYFRLLAVKRQIQHQNKKWSLYDHMVMRTYDYMMKIIWLWWLLLIACYMNTKQPLNRICYRYQTVTPNFSMIWSIFPLSSIFLWLCKVKLIRLSQTQIFIF